MKSYIEPYIERVVSEGVNRLAAAVLSRVGRGNFGAVYREAVDVFYELADRGEDKSKVLELVEKISIERGGEILSHPGFQRFARQAIDQAYARPVGQIEADRREKLIEGEIRRLGNSLLRYNNPEFDDLDRAAEEGAIIDAVRVLAKHGVDSFDIMERVTSYMREEIEMDETVYEADTGLIVRLLGRGIDENAEAERRLIYGI